MHPYRPLGFRFNSKRTGEKNLVTQAESDTILNLRIPINAHPRLLILYALSN